MGLPTGWKGERPTIEDSKSKVSLTDCHDALSVWQQAKVVYMGAALASGGETRDRHVAYNSEALGHGKEEG